MKRILMLCLALSALFVCSVPALAFNSQVVDSTLDIAQAKKNMVGPGYNWQNRDDTLTLNGLHLVTTDDYGLRLPKACTVILSGENYIRADKYALSCAGTVTFKGNGKLILEAGEIGMYLYSEDGTQKIRLLDGTYEIHAGDYGVFSTASDFSFVDGSMTISVDNADGAAVSGRIVHLLGGKFTADNAVDATHILEVRGVDLDLTCTRPAFSAPKLSVSSIALKADGADIAEYDGQYVISGKSTYKPARPSAIFGEDVNGAWDYVCLAVLVLAIAAAIVIPVLHRKKKKEQLLARLETENPDAAAVLKK
ncbi:MAG: hypothetical protein IJ325_13215 [Clostridia bacterium]|nr:hypothetical protein [Clostridia bacterium]